MEKIENIAKFVTKNEEFFRARIRQNDSKHVFINDWKFTISAGSPGIIMEKHLEIIINPSDIERFMTDVEEIISKSRLKDYQDMVKLFLKFKASHTYGIIQEELKRDPFMIKEFDRSNLLHLFQNYLISEEIENHDYENFLTVGNIKIYFPIKEIWNKFIVQFYTYNQIEEFRDPVYGRFIRESIKIINVDDKLMINFVIPLSSIENQIENYRETIDNLVFQTFPNYSHEINNDYELLITTNFECREHKKFEVVNIKKWDQIYSQLNHNYYQLLRDFLTIFMPVYNYRYTSSNHDYVNKKIRKLLEIVNIPYKIDYDADDSIVLRFEKPDGLKIDLGIRGLNHMNLPFKCTVRVNRINDFWLDSQIYPNGNKYMDFTFTSNHTN